MVDRGIAELLPRRVAADPARPLVTFYDDATGERVELSGRTFDNWVAKTANFLVDGLDVQPGGRVALALPPHWQTAVWLFACWAAGVAVELVEPGAVPAADVLAAAEGALPDAPGAEVVGLSLHALGAPLRDCPPGVVDYAAEVRGYGDRFVPPVPADPAAPALIVTNTTFTGVALAAEATEIAGRYGLDAQSRVFVGFPATTREWVLSGLLAPIAAGGSVIIQRNLDNGVLDRRLSLEHVSAVAGVTGWNDASGSIRRLL
ncbi:TIGR03089 family protein [Actinomadura craniellae]|uniref:TIGR03089 family protein n=1 Tax=Actinomadura craniellae TaxID=2231787 RepID=A0A365H539_9ACTN|nr:TIGR03089 family protein [Actinomadura craniellae]RAY14230.1 TIGR03089 family protein [Actinomadura craniellae]